MTEELYFYKLVESTYDYSKDNNYVGIWDYYTEYNVGNIVFLNDIYYKCLYGTIADLPSSHPLLWEVLVPYSVLVKDDYTLMDIDKVDIVRTYTSPYFSDIERLKNNGTYTIKLPQTINNKAFFEYCHRSDTTSDIPYDYIYADYFYNGLTVFLNAEVKVLDTVLFYEVQCVYGVNRLKYLPLFEKKLNEIIIDDINVLFSDWIVNWHFNSLTTAMYESGHKYSYPFYYSGIRTRDVETTSNNIVYNLLPDTTIREHIKYMTEHPFVLASDVFQLINDHYGINMDFTELNTKLENLGHILSGNKVKNYNATQGNFGVYNVNQNSPVVLLDTLSSITAFPFNLYNGGGAYNYILQLDKYVFGELPPVKIRLTADFKLNRQYGVSIYKTVNNVKTILENINYNDDIGYVDGYYTYNEAKEIELTREDVNAIITFECSGGVSPYVFKPDYNNKMYCETVELNSSYYSINGDGYYDCIANLPDLLPIEYIQQWLIYTCGFLGYTTSGELKTYFFDEFVDNLHNGTIYDWSTRYSGLRKSTFQFNGNAKNNYIKFANDKDLINKKTTITVNDNTIDYQKDLYTLKLDSTLGIDGSISEFILYNQTVKRSGTNGVSFENNYVGDKFNCGICLKQLIEGSSPERYNAINVNAISANYATYQKLIERPIVYECDLNLSVYESSNIDFAKPVYIDVIGKYCLLLELQAPNNELCAAKLLLINQTL